MKNYYAEFLQIKNVNTLDNQVSKVSKDTRKVEKQAFDTFDTCLPNVNQKNSIAESLIERLNRMIAAGASFDVATDDFQVCGADKLTDAEKGFLAINKIQILCTLQQGLLVRHLFSHKPELQQIFISQIEKRGADLQTVCEITTKWFARLLEKTS